MNNNHYPGPALTAADLEVLEFERTPWRYEGKKETAVLERFGHRLTRYYQRLNQVIDQPAAEVYDPALVHRLRGLRATRRASRTRTGVTA
jgi:hypothetical protein